MGRSTAVYAARSWASRWRTAAPSARAGPFRADCRQVVVRHFAAPRAFPAKPPVGPLPPPAPGP
eukprot:11155626-Lingulodinium_polyedra.AAC.1